MCYFTSDTLLSMAASRHWITLCLSASEFTGNPSVCLIQYSYKTKQNVIKSTKRSNV
ncbi:hypothetical protein Hanom_Chr16g01505651 [Helianthus anomalus]